MQLVKCAACGADVSKAAKACPKCGHPIASNWWAIRAVAILLVGAVAIAAFGRWMGIW